MVCPEFFFYNTYLCVFPILLCEILVHRKILQCVKKLFLLLINLFFQAYFEQKYKIILCHFFQFLSIFACTPPAAESAVATAVCDFARASVAACTEERIGCTGAPIHSAPVPVQTASGATETTFLWGGGGGGRGARELRKVNLGMYTLNNASQYSK